MIVTLISVEVRHGSLFSPCLGSSEGDPVKFIAKTEDAIRYEKIIKGGHLAIRLEPWQYANPIHNQKASAGRAST